MDFFKSILSTDPELSDPEVEEEEEEEEGDQEQDEQQHEEGNSRKPSSPFSALAGVGAWKNFGGLIKTISTRSESVIQTYRRDLEEFSTGLKKETAVFTEVASRAVRDLPGSLEAGASVAQESLETVGQAIDDFGGSVWRGTADIISQGKEALLSIDADSNSADLSSSESSSQVPGRRYSRFEAQVIAIQNDGNTYVEEPEGSEHFEKWKLGFNLEEKQDEIEGLLNENGILEGYFEKFVPDLVDPETFWSRYFYRVYRLKQAEEARAKLVKRVISGEEEEELSWEVDDDEDDNAQEAKAEDDKVEEGVKEEKQGEEKASHNVIAETSESKPLEAKEKVIELSPESAKPAEEQIKKESTEISESVEENKSVKASQVENLEEVENIKTNRDEDLNSKSEDKVHSEVKSEPGDSSKDSDYSMISSQPSTHEEDDPNWDEIEDLGDHEDKKMAGSSGSPKRVDLLKRMSVAEDDEDLSWDIEDDEK